MIKNCVFVLLGSKKFALSSYLGGKLLNGSVLVMFWVLHKCISLWECIPIFYSYKARKPILSDFISSFLDYIT